MSFFKFPQFFGGTQKSGNFQQYTIFIFGQKMVKYSSKMAKIAKISKMVMTTVGLFLEKWQFSKKNNSKLKFNWFQYFYVFHLT